MHIRDTEVTDAILSSFHGVVRSLPKNLSERRWFENPMFDRKMLGMMFREDVNHTVRDGFQGFCDSVEMEFWEANGNDAYEKLQRILVSVISEVEEYTCAAVRAMLQFFRDDEKEVLLEKLFENGWTGTVLASSSAKPINVENILKRIDDGKIRFKTGHMGAQNEAKRFFRFLSKDIAEHPENVETHAALIRAVEIRGREKTPELVAAMEEYAYASLAAIQPGDDNGPVL